MIKELIQQTKNLFYQFVDKLADLKDKEVNVQEYLRDMKIKSIKIPGIQQIIDIFEKNVNK